MQPIQSGTRSADLFPRTYSPRTAGSLQRGTAATNLEQSQGLNLLTSPQPRKLEVVGTSPSAGVLSATSQPPQNSNAYLLVGLLFVVGLALAITYFMKVRAPQHDE